MKFEIKHRWTGETIYTAELEARFEEEPRSIQLGAAVELAVKAGADLRGADLRGAKWQDGITLKRAPIQLYNLDGGWPVTILDEHMEIGCELHSFDEWAAFTDKEITAMDGRRALEFWRRWKPALMALCEARREEGEQENPAVATFAASGAGS